MEGDEMRKLWLPIVMCAGLMASSVAGGETTDVFLMSLEELLDLRISVASVQAKPIRKQPGIVTVITSADIRESGARDLEDILHRVPGFATGLDVTGVTGMGFRGFWAYVGQILFIVDGLEITDGLFGVFPTGGHIPAAQIERIEIIRGPGSARYGGNAELAVIKITTKAAKQDGVSVHTSFGTSGDSFSQRYGYTFGQNFEDGHAYLGASLGRDYRSDRDYRGSDGTVFDMAGDSDIDTLLLTFGLDYKGLTVKGLLDSYHLDERTHYGEPQADTYDMDFDTFVASVEYDWGPLDRLTLTPKVTYDRQNPWAMESEEWSAAQIGGNYVIETERFTYNLIAVYEMSDSSSLEVGAESYHERAKATDTDDGTNLHFEDTTTDSVSYDSTAVFGQYEVDTSLANFTVGCRYQDHSYAGDAFVPRAGITKVWDRWHAKLLYGESFRTPQIELITLATAETIEPETATAYEMEVGYLLSDTISVVGSVFHASIEDILVFGLIEGSTVETYANREELSTYGFEGELRIRDEWGNASVGYSFYRPYKNTVDTYDSGDDDLLVGFPAHKLTFNATYYLTKKFSANASGIWTSKRLGYNADTVGDTVVEFDPDFILDLFAEYRAGRLAIGAGVKNLFDERIDYVQPYNGWTPPLPDKSREFFVNLSMDI